MLDLSYAWDVVSIAAFNLLTFEIKDVPCLQHFHLQFIQTTNTLFEKLNFLTLFKHPIIQQLILTLKEQMLQFQNGVQSVLHNRRDDDEDKDSTADWEHLQSIMNETAMKKMCIQTKMDDE